MNRIDAMFAQCRAENRKALIIYLTAGDPDLETTAELIRALPDAGADLIEVGVPFSDPMADGPTIQAASERALASGTTLRGILAMVSDLRTDVHVPMILFSYYNVLFNVGVDAIAEQAHTAGLDGMLVVDVPFEELEEIRPALQGRGLYPIALLAPTTGPERARVLTENARGFVYCITVTGVTGARNALPEELSEQLSLVRDVSPVPVVAGFGISSPDMAKTVARHADGIVVGSALVKRMAEASNPKQGIADCVEFVRSLAEALR